MNNVKLVGIKKCPVCGGVDREISNGMSSENGLHYLKHAAAALGLSVEDMVARAKVYRCLSCGSYFCDPWLSPELASLLFCAGSPDHIAGWANFESWLPRNRNLTGRLYSIVTRRIGPISTYAEFGCPFQGFLLQFKEYETSPSERISLFARALNRQPDVRWSRIPRFYNRVQCWCGRLAVLAFRFIALLASWQGHIRRDNDVRVVTPPRHRYLLTQENTNGWGSNCVRYGASCRYFAHTMCDASVIPINELIYQNGSQRFDLIGIFNTLDHTMFPLDLLKKALELSDYILVVGHTGTGAGKQHLFSFCDDCVAWLNRELDGISAVDLNSEIDPEGIDNNHYILVSRNAMNQ